MQTSSVITGGDFSLVRLKIHKFTQLPLRMVKNNRGTTQAYQQPIPQQGPQFVPVPVSHRKSEFSSTWALFGLFVAGLAAANIYLVLETKSVQDAINDLRDYSSSGSGATKTGNDSNSSEEEPSIKFILYTVFVASAFVMLIIFSYLALWYYKRAWSKKPKGEITTASLARALTVQVHLNFIEKLMVELVPGLTLIVVGLLLSRIGQPVWGGVVIVIGFIAMVGFTGMRFIRMPTELMDSRSRAVVTFVPMLFFAILTIVMFLGGEASSGTVFLIGGLVWVALATTIAFTREGMENMKEQTGDSTNLEKLATAQRWYIDLMRFVKGRKTKASAERNEDLEAEESEEAAQTAEMFDEESEVMRDAAQNADSEGEGVLTGLKDAFWLVVNSITASGRTSASDDTGDYGPVFK